MNIHCREDEDGLVVRLDFFLLSAIGRTNMLRVILLRKCLTQENSLRLKYYWEWNNIIFIHSLCSIILCIRNYLLQRDGRPKVQPSLLSLCLPVAFVFSASYNSSRCWHTNLSLFSWQCPTINAQVYRESKLTQFTNRYRPCRNCT